MTLMTYSIAEDNISKLENITVETIRNETQSEENFFLFLIKRTFVSCGRISCDLLYINWSS